MEKLSEKDVKNERVTQRLHGVIVHGIGSWFFVVEPAITAKGANQGEFSTSDVFDIPNPDACVHILTHLITVVTIINEAIQHIRPSARYLSVQLDGASENWNKSVLGFCHLLVDCGRFDEVQISSK